MYGLMADKGGLLLLMMCNIGHRQDGDGSGCGWVAANMNTNFNIPSWCRGQDIMCEEYSTGFDLKSSNNAYCTDTERYNLCFEVQ